MIPQNFIYEWNQQAPWQASAQIEQDLILSRVLVEIFSDPFLANSLAFRGGTALHKLFIVPAGRYSEDIDLVQITEGPIGPALNAIRERLDSWLGKPKWKQNLGRVTLIYRFDSQLMPITSTRLKIEINTREHFSVSGLIQKTFEVNSEWFKGAASITTYTLEELLGTKLRALHQRKKGRDLFDLTLAFKKYPALDADKIITCFQAYLKQQDTKISRANFEACLADKLQDTAFTADIISLLPTTALNNYDALSEVVPLQKLLIAKLPGEAWKGNGKF